MGAVCRQCFIDRKPSACGASPNSQATMAAVSASALPSRVVPVRLGSLLFDLDNLNDLFVTIFILVN